jgi:hypothetical protein
MGFGRQKDFGRRLARQSDNDSRTLLLSSSASVTPASANP